MNTRLACIALALALFLAPSVGSAAAGSSKAKSKTAAKPGPSLTAGKVTAIDCPLATQFKGQRPSKDACTSKKFFDDPGLPSASSAKQVCLGFKGSINAKLPPGKSYCRRLTASKWTIDLNMRFIQCASQGKLGRVAWVTKASSLNKSYLGREKSVTFSEMCYWKQLGKAFPK